MRRLAVLALAVGLLAGCAPGSDANGNDGGSGSGGDKPKNLTFVSFTDGPDLDVQKVVPFNYILAMSVVSMVPVVIIFLVLQRHIVQGIAQTGFR